MTVQPASSARYPENAEKPDFIPRFVTAASLFDGHDASINIMRRILQASGAEIIHLGHNRAVHEIVNAAVQEDVDGIAVSSYQGGHLEFFKYMVDMLRERGSGHIKVFGGGGGVIIASEIQELHDYGVARIYSPDDGQSLGLQGMIDDMLGICRRDRQQIPADPAAVAQGNIVELARLITQLENSDDFDSVAASIRAMAGKNTATVPVLGITGTGGSGKSSLTDELILRFRRDYGDSIRIAVIAVDPTRRKTGGALLGDRIRMNSIDSENIYMRSLATRHSRSEIPDYTASALDALRLSGFDLIILETPGIGQGDMGITEFVDQSLYVMTPEFGAASQLEKIDMLDYADVVAINKFDRRGAEDAYRDVCKQVQRNRMAFDRPASEMPVFGTRASHFNDSGVTALYGLLARRLQDSGLKPGPGRVARVDQRISEDLTPLLPASRIRYLAEIAASVRQYHDHTGRQATLLRQVQQIRAVSALLDKQSPSLARLLEKSQAALDREAVSLLEIWHQTSESYKKDQLVVSVRGREIQNPLAVTSLSGTRVPRVALPRYSDHGDLYSWLRSENLPGFFPFTAGVFPFKRQNEDPTRMFAGEGDPFRTNRRFRYLSQHSEAKRLSTAFDSVTLYGWDPAERPDIYGKVGNSGVSVCTLDDLKALYDGFDLCDPMTSVSMTINGPAPTILAMFLNTAIDQKMAEFEAKQGRVPADRESQAIRRTALESVRGTVQADILKEDQGQNTCIFSTEFSLRMMGDIQAYFIENKIRNFYSVSISGYHIAEAGANPITQLALTLANGFTYVESYLSRGMAIDDFAPNLSFFFSNGMDPEYTVMGRVARRIWAVAMRERYGASERSQKLKYHIQTSGRSLHAQEMDFNDIRTTLQALIAIYDNCNSLHTNAHDEAITTPTEDSVRRAMAIQLVINKEWGLAKNENSSQGSFIIDELTELVEAAVLAEFERISERGGVLGAMETGYQRARIQDESMHYEHKKHDGTLPIIGVNTFLKPASREPRAEIELARSTDQEKRNQIQRLSEFQDRNAEHCDLALRRIQQAAVRNENVFVELMNAVRHCSLGQITNALFEVGGRYRRNM